MSSIACLCWVVYISRKREDLSKTNMVHMVWILVVLIVNNIYTPRLSILCKWDDDVVIHLAELIPHAIYCGFIFLLFRYYSRQQEKKLESFIV